MQACKRLKKYREVTVQNMQGEKYKYILYS